MTRPQIKFCGLKEQIHIDFCTENCVDFVGFVFHEQSPRNIPLEAFAELNLESARNVVAVFQNPTAEKITQVLQKNRVDFIQIHGEIPHKFIGDERVIKAFSGENFLQSDFEKYDFCKYFLFDGIKSGSGNSRDFAYINNIKPFMQKPFFLAGGINKSNIHKALIHANMIDLSSGIEETRGVKSIKMMEEFLMIFGKYT